MQETINLCICGNTCHFYHRASGLYLAPYRAYNSKTGKWLSREPLGLDGPNLYHYGFGNPVNNFDSTGLETNSFDWWNPGDWLLYGTQSIIEWGYYTYDGIALASRPYGGYGSYGSIRSQFAQAAETLDKNSGNLNSIIMLPMGTATARSSANVSVYCSIDDGVVNYIGITNNLDRRAAQHARDKGLGNIAPLINDLTRADAKAVEQVLIEQYGLSKNGGTLLNKINSVSSTNPQYAAQLARGREILINNGYKE